MSSSMMRGIPLNNSSLGINMRNNLVIEIDDSGDDSDDNTLHIVEESTEQSIEIDDSESEEQAMVIFFNSHVFDLRQRIDCRCCKYCEWNFYFSFNRFDTVSMSTTHLFV